jgi:hypothetical protein
MVHTDHSFSIWQLFRKKKCFFIECEISLLVTHKHAISPDTELVQLRSDIYQSSRFTSIFWQLQGLDSGYISKTRSPKVSPKSNISSKQKVMYLCNTEVMYVVDETWGGY